MSFEQSVLRVYNGNPSQGGTFAGTAFFINPQYLLSARHVFTFNCPKGSFLRLPTGEIWQAPSSALEHCNTNYGQRDIVLIKLPRIFNNYYPPIATRKPEVGDTVTVCGFFDDTQSLHQRTTSISGYTGLQHAFNLSDTIPYGMSGGAVLFESQLIGLIYARDKDKDISYFIPIDEILIFINSLKIEITFYDSIHPVTQKYKNKIKQLNEFKDSVETENFKAIELKILEQWLNEYTDHD